MIYAINLNTKEHCIVYDNDAHGATKLGDSPHIVGYRFVEADADGWIEWGGGECPLTYSHEVEVMTRNAATWHKRAGDKRWCHDGVASDIIAYRPILEPQAEQANEWNGEGIPPVGTPLEGEHADYGWIKGRFMFHDEEERVVVLKTEHGYLGFGVYRALRTDRERWIEAAHRACDHSSNLIDMYGSIYDAGLARLPGE